MTIPEMYECDPSKNKECSKTGCFINGGDCFYTSKKHCVIENAMRRLESAIKVAMRQMDVTGAQILYRAFCAVKDEYKRNEDDLK